MWGQDLYDEQPMPGQGYRGEDTPETKFAMRRFVSPLVSSNMILYGVLLRVLDSENWIATAMVVLGLAANLDFLFS